MHKLKGYLQLMRPANIVTAVADILAGVVISGYFSSPTVSLTPVLLLVIATIGLYGGGVVFNDVFDAQLDKLERPERAIPSGLISERNAAYLGLFLLSMAIISAFFVHHEQLVSLSLILAVGIAIAALVYDKWGKHHPLLGPVNMGTCRGLNLLLGMSIVASVAIEYWWLAFSPIVYIAAITMISRDEVHGSKRNTLYLAALLYLMVISVITWFAFSKDNLMYAVWFILLFGIMIFRPLTRAIKDPVAMNIRKSVKAGVVAVILMDAAWAASFGDLTTALIILGLLPVSVVLARLFAVT